MAYTSGPESQWALFKRGLYVVDNDVSVKGVGRYSAEFSGRRNLRPLETHEQMAAVG